MPDAIDPGLTATVIAGFVLVAAVTFDIFGTALHGWIGHGPIAKCVIRFSWRLLLFVTRFLSARRRRLVLGWVGPFLVPLVILVWTALGVFAFALLVMPLVPGRFLSGSQIPLRNSLFDAMYYSAVTLFTLGYGSILPVTDMARLFAMAEAAWGFSVISLVTSYFVTLAGAGSAGKRLADRLYFQTGRSADAAQLIVRSSRSGTDPERLATEVIALRDRLSAVQIDLINHPTLFYRPEREARQSYLRALFVIRELVLLLDIALDPEVHPEIAGFGERSGLRDALRTAQDNALELMVRTWPGLGVKGSGERQAGDSHHWAQRFQHARLTLCEAGIGVREGGQPIREYVQERSEWEPPLKELAEAMGADWDEVSEGR